MMTTRERTLNTLRRSRPDRIPWLADLAYWIDYLFDEGLMPEKYLREESNREPQSIISQGLAGRFSEDGLQALHRDLNVGFYLQGYFPFTTHYDGVEITEAVTRNGRDLSRVTTIHTPYGDMREIWDYICDTHSWAPREHMIKGLSDLKKLRYLYEHTRYEPDYDLAGRRYTSAGDNGVVLCYIPKCPIMELIALRAGVMTTAYMMMDDEKEMELTLALMEEKIDESCKLALDSPAECIMSPDNLSSESIGVPFYTRFGKPFHQKWCDRIRERGKFSFVHLDGTIKPLISELSDAGFDVIEALTPHPVGDIPFSEIRPLVKPETILWGGIPAGFFRELNDEDFDAYVKALILAMKADGRSVLAVGDQVVPGSSFERVARVARLVEEHGKY